MARPVNDLTSSGFGAARRGMPGVLLAFAALLLTGPAVHGQGPVAVSVTAGLGVPAAALFRDVYGSRLTPIGAQAQWRISTSGFGVFGGVRWVSRGGEAIIEGSSQPSEEPVDFRMMSWRTGPTWTGGRGAWQVTLGAGPSYSTYRETWDAAGLRQEDGGLGFVFQGTLAREVTRRLGVLLRIERSVLNVEAPGDGLGQVNLGATDIAGGIAFRF